ncbi:hypothetical protein GGR56DRAFT_676887 [Xylariaceae sp. FL0804]|nr:hypothetical protein GGR56DRAFT_676887 [Xylariaceae sp. FL0804]
MENKVKVYREMWPRFTGSNSSFNSNHNRFSNLMACIRFSNIRLSNTRFSNTRFSNTSLSNIRLSNTSLSTILFIRLSSTNSTNSRSINSKYMIMSAPSRPADPLKAVEYDVVRIVWRDPRNTSEYSYNKALKDFGNYVFNELWAQINELKKQLDETQDKTSRGKLQSDMTGKYDLIHAAIKTALAFGDDHLLRHTGQHAKLMVALFTALRRRFASSKSTYNDSFTKTVLKFLSCITTMDNDQLNARLKFDAFRNKYYEGLDEEGRVYLNEISSNASRADSQTVRQLDTAIGVKNEKENLSKKPAVPAVKSAAPTSAAAPKTAGSKPTIPLKKTASEVKKIQPTDYSGLGSARKVSNGSSKVNASASPFKRAREDDVDSRAPKKVAVEGATGVTASSKVAPATAKSEPKAPTAPSTIGGLLAEIAKPIEKQKPREEPAKASETPEEKTRRLRKEARRGLRVAWKPDRELVEYRIFEHDSAEDEGRASNMVRDARDNRSEGQMLKMKRDIQEDEEEDEEDRRDEKPKEVELQTWSPPSLANLSPLDQQQREKNYVTRAGLREVESEQKKVMEEYENRELMAIYTSFSEIPETPRSPLSRDIDGSNEAKIAYLPADNPKFQEIHRRWAEVHQFGITTATHLALQRLGISPSDAAASSLRGSPSARSSLTSHGKAPGATKSSTSHAPRMMTQAERDAEVLFLLQSGRARAYIDPSPYDPEKANAEQRQVYNDPKVQGAAEFIERISAQLKDLPFPPTEPPKWMLANPDRVKEWHTGRNNDFAAKAKRDASARAAKLAEEHARRMAENASASSTTAQTIPYGAYQPQQQQSHQISQAPTQVPDQYAAILQQVQALQGNPSAQNPPLPATPQPDQSLQNLLAALGQGQTQQPASQASQQAPDYNYWQAWAQSQAQAYGAQAYGGQGQTAPAYTEQYDGAVHDGQQAYGSQHQGYPSQQAQQSGPQRREDGEWGSRKDFSSRVNKDLKGINRALIGTKACSFWAKGQCAKGDSCTFRHDPNDLK